ncbi:hypothetical protein [Priestia megaterium]|uniref:hypothetical protein n=1 Tax=Priestia megaterium TaxID=1404 RepID=UPI002E216B46|nr:hypothetical protein [Priestia megaterium]
MKHQEQCQLIRKLGFLHVRLYEDIGEGAYYDAVTPDGRKAEVVIQENQVLWRELHPTKIEWFTIDIEQDCDEKTEASVEQEITVEQLILAI